MVSLPIQGLAPGDNVPGWRQEPFWELKLCFCILVEKREAGGLYPSVPHTWPGLPLQTGLEPPL